MFRKQRIYFSAKGIRRSGSKAKIASFSPALSTPGLGGDMPDYLPVMYGVAWTLDKIYSRIKSGKFWSDNTDDYFDILAWHPYVFTNRECEDKDLFYDVDEPDQLWKSYNHAAYKVMKKYGDGHKEVIMTESGFTDFGNPEWEKRYAGYNKKMLEIARELPYVRTLHNFRLLNENAMLQRAGVEDNQIGGLSAVYFGIFTDPEEGCRPRARAYAIAVPTVLLVNTGAPVEMTEASGLEYVKAILYMAQAGQEGGNAVADVRSGDVNPSGKLTMT